VGARVMAQDVQHKGSRVHVGGTVELRVRHALAEARHMGSRVRVEGTVELRVRHALADAPHTGTP
jgi:hypothetical protein